MPTRRNPYSAQTYGSSALSPRYYGGGGVDIATPLANLAATIGDLATYDPQYDAEGQGARLRGAQADEIQSERTGRTTAAGLITDPNVDQSSLLRSILPHVGPKSAAEYALLQRANRHPADGKPLDFSYDPMAIARGDTTGSTMSSSTYGERMKPTPVYSSDGESVLLKAAQDSIDMRPVLTKEQETGRVLQGMNLSRPEQAAVVGAEPKDYQAVTVRLPNGKTEIMSQAEARNAPAGSMLISATGSNSDLGLTNRVESDVQSNQLELDNFLQTTSVLRSMSGDATNFGLPGKVKDLATQGMSLVNGFAQLTGKDYQKEIDTIAATPLDDGKGGQVKIDITRFDPRIHGLKAFAELAAYQSASAFAKQSGRSLALPELEAHRNIIGIPQSVLMDQKKFLAGIDMLEAHTKRLMGANTQALAGGVPKAPGAAPAAAPAAPPIPPVGTVEDGYQFNGGDPSVQSNWTPVR